MKCAGRGRREKKKPANPVTVQCAPWSSAHSDGKSGRRRKGESRKASVRRSNLGEGVARPSHMTLWMSGRSRQETACRKTKSRETREHVRKTTAAGSQNNITSKAVAAGVGSFYGLVIP